MQETVFWDLAPCIFWLEPTFRRNVSPPSSGQVNRDENIVSRCLQMFGCQGRSTYIVSWQGGAGEWEMVGEVMYQFRILYNYVALVLSTLTSSCVRYSFVTDCKKLEGLRFGWPQISSCKSVNNLKD
jgi:hypothetical protein